MICHFYLLASEIPVTICEPLNLSPFMGFILSNSKLKVSKRYLFSFQKQKKTKKNKSYSCPEIWRQQINEKWFCIVSTGFLGLLVLGEFSCWFLHLQCFSVNSAEFSPVTTLMIHKFGGPISKFGLLYLILSPVRGDFLYLIEWTVLGFLV